MRRPVDVDKVPIVCFALDLNCGVLWVQNDHIFNMFFVFSKAVPNIANKGLK